MVKQIMAYLEHLFRKIKEQKPLLKERRVSKKAGIVGFFCLVTMSHLPLTLINQNKRQVLRYFGRHTIVPSQHHLLQM